MVEIERRRNIDERPVSHAAPTDCDPDQCQKPRPPKDAMRARNPIWTTPQALDPAVHGPFQPGEIPARVGAPESEVGEGREECQADLAGTVQGRSAPTACEPNRQLT